MLIPKPDRIRSPAHLKRLRTLPCCIPGCTVRPVVAHHLTCSPHPKARGLKAGDQWTVPLCFLHHRPTSRASVHHQGDERAWWASHGLDPLTIAAQAWAETQRMSDNGGGRDQ